MSSTESNNNNNNNSDVQNAKRFSTRETLKHSKRIVVKIGSAIITREDQCGISLSRLGHIVEQIFEIRQKGIEVIVVSSGAVSIGRQKLNEFQKLLSANQRNRNDQPTLTIDKRSCAAAGQSGLMALYTSMFGYFDIGVSQILVTGPDFKDNERRQQLRNTIEVLLSCGVIPIVNENDVVSIKMDMLDTSTGLRPFNDNDGLAALIATGTGADLLILLSDVEGVYTSPPGTPGSVLLHCFNPSVDSERIKFNGQKSKVGTGGMESKILAATQTLDAGCSVVIASGLRRNTIVDIVDGKRVGTLFSYHEDDGFPREMAVAARGASRKLQALSSEDRSRILLSIADALEANEMLILQENVKDVEKAERDCCSLSASSLARLRLNHKKIATLVEGIRSIAAEGDGRGGDPIGRVLRRMELAPDLHLTQQTAPLGVLLVIFESRPDALPQVASLAIRSGNGLLLKGGREATHSNRVLHKIIVDAITAAAPEVPREIISLIESREDINELLALDDLIDLVIPRGSSQLVSFIQRNTRIPVLGHSEGICHVFVDQSAPLDKATSIVLDSKTDYPAACNAMETLLVHSELYKDGRMRSLIAALHKANVVVHAGPRLAARVAEDGSLPADDELRKLPLAPSLKYEFGDLQCTVELVDSIREAIDHVHEYGSGHTDSIVTEDPAAAAKWLNEVDSACVFHNASTRFADGYRFGLGAEVGISTSRIHARGPVGVDGLLTTKWKLQSKSTEGHIVAPFSKGDVAFTHRPLHPDVASSNTEQTNKQTKTVIVRFQEIL